VSRLFQTKVLSLTEDTRNGLETQGTADAVTITGFETTLPPPSPPPTLRARLSWLWGGSKKRKREDEPPPVSVFKRQRVYETPPELALPRVPEGKIPRSKAPKVEEAGEKAPLPNPKVLDTEALEARAVQTRMAEARNGAEDGALDAVDKATGA
jgi:hypothetical protein